jgi:hypothetical protein
VRPKKTPFPTGLAYAGNGFGTHYGKATIAFVPFARIAAAVG